MRYSIPNAQGQRDVLGTWRLALLAGHKRFVNITELRGDALSPQILGMKKSSTKMRCAAHWPALDKSGANTAAMDDINARGETPVIVRQDHRAVKRVTKPMLNSKSLQAAKSVLAEI